MPVSIKSLIPKNTIVGKVIAGDKTGALASAKNYVKSGELATDIKNVGLAISTGNVAPVLMKASGVDTKKLLDKGGSVTSLKPTPAQTSNANQAQTEANIALAVGSGVPASQANLIGNSPSFAMANADAGSPNETKSNTWAYVLGAGVLLLIGGKKKVRTYARRKAVSTYRRARSYGRKTYSRAMSYRTKKR